MSVLKIKDPATGEWLEIQTIKGDTGPRGPKGDKGDKGDTGEVSQAEFDVLAGDVDDLKSAINDLSDIQTITDYSDRVNLGPTATKVNIYPNNDLFSIYVPVSAGIIYTVSKAVPTSRLRLGTTAAIPQYNEPVIDFIQDDTASSLTLKATGDSKYLLICFWRPADSVDYDTALAGLSVIANAGAKDVTARADVADLADDYTTFRGDVAVLQPSPSIYNLPDKTETVYKGELTNSVKDGILSLDGVLTQTGFTLTLPSVVLTGYNTVNVEVISGTYTGNVYFFLPIGGNAFFTNLGSSTQRTEYFDGSELAVSFYAANGATFDNYKVRIWIKEGLFNAPYEAAHYALAGQKVVACSALEFNTPMYSRLEDDVLYNIFGDRFAVCKNGALSRYGGNDITKFALLSDLHYIMTGDIIDSGYFSTPGTLQTQIGVYKASMASIGCPVFPFAGNHDDDVNEFAHHGVIDFGPVRFVYFWADYDSQTVGGIVRASEISWIEEQLQTSTAKYNILACHYAVSTDEGFLYPLDAEGRAAIEDLAAEYGVKLYLNGHQHDHSVSVGSAGVMTDINLPNGKYAYCLCTIDSNGLFTLVVHNSEDDSVLKSIAVQL